MPGELRPEGGLQGDVLAHRHDAQVGHQRHDLGHLPIELVQAVGVHCDRGVMLPEQRATRRHVVLGECEFVAQAHRLVVGRAHAPEGEVHAPERLAALHEGEALGDGHLERQPKELVEQPRQRLSGIILDGHQRHKTARQRTRRCQLDRVLPEADAAGGQMLAQIAVRQLHWAVLAIVEPRQELHRLRAPSVWLLDQPERAWPVTAECRDERVARRVERAEVAGDRSIVLWAAPAAEQPAQPVRPAEPPLQRSPHDGQEQVVDVHPLGREALLPAAV